MECYVLSKTDLSILSICKLADYQINLDEETNAKSTFTLMKTNGLKKENYMVLNGLYRQFIFVIDDVQTEKESDVVTVTALDISNVFNRKVIEKNIDTMKNKSIEEFLANTISENFVNSDDTALNANYIEIYWHTNTQGNVATNAENGLYNFHTFLINCRQYKNIYTDFKLENLGNPQTVEGKRISLEAKNRKIVDISLHGESIQNGTPTPENKVDIENVEGKNILDISKYADISLWEKTTNYFMFTPILNEDMTKFKNVLSGSMQLKGTAQNLVFGLTTEKVTPTKELRILNNGTLQNTSYDFKNADNIYLAIGNSNMISSDKYEIGLIFNNYNIMIEEGSVATSYVPYNSLELKATNGLEETDENYQEQVATFPLGEEKLMEGSYLADDGIHHKRRQRIFDGTETDWSICNDISNENYTVFRQNKYVAGSGLVTNSNGFSSHFKVEKATNTTTDNVRFINTNHYGICFTVSTSIASTVDEWKTYLAEQYANGTPVIVEYELAEPETVPYTAEQQTVWDKIKNLTLFEGVNHISSDANMVLKYYPLEPVGLKFVLRIDIENKQETTELIDTTLPEVADYNKIYEEDVTAKVQVYIREDGSEYNLYLKTDRTTTTNKDDPDRASGKIEVISVETADKAEEEALNVMKGNNYKHLVEFKIAKTSKLMDITELHIGRPIRIKTDDDIYDSYISAITLSDENFVYFKSGRLRITLLDKLKKSNNSIGNKLDVTGGKILGNLNILDNAYFGKNGVAFGAPYDTEEGGPLQVDGAKIIESGSNENGSWTKWSDGTMICRKTMSYTNIAINNAWGSLYESNSSLNIGNYAMPFINVPEISITPCNPIIIEKIGDATASSFGTFYAAKPKTAEETFTINCIAIGRWK